MFPPSPGKYKGSRWGNFWHKGNNTKEGEDENKDFLLTLLKMYFWKAWTLQFHINKNIYL